MDRNNVAVALVFIGISAFLFWQSFTIGSMGQNSGDLGPAFFPRMLIVLIVILSLLLFIKKPQSVTEERKQSRNDYRLENTLLVTIGFVVLFSLVGAYLAIPLFLATFLFIWNSRNIATLVLLPTGVTLVIYLLFHQLLSIRLPKGVWNILF